MAERANSQIVFLVPPAVVGRKTDVNTHFLSPSTTPNESKFLETLKLLYNPCYKLCSQLPDFYWKLETHLLSTALSAAFWRRSSTTFQACDITCARRVCSTGRFVPGSFSPFFPVPLLEKTKKLRFGPAWDRKNWMEMVMNEDERMKE